MTMIDRLADFAVGAALRALDRLSTARILTLLERRRADDRSAG